MKHAILCLIPVFFLLACLNCTNPSIANDQEASPFVLPYPVGEAYTCMQGWYGPYSHFGVFKYSVDFTMPIGTEITAARDGVVNYTLDSHSDSDDAAGLENVLVIMHSDSTFSRYIHLTHNGILVKVGDIVKRGDKIALSGKSGTDLPHLHFDITKGSGDRKRQTIPFVFRNTIAQFDGPKQGVIYKAYFY